jgi:lysine 2,3-aminomutase
MSLAGKTLRDATALARSGLVEEAAVPALNAVAARYVVAVTPTIAELIAAGDVADPIARQFLPSPRELDMRSEERADPIGDRPHAPVEGIVHRYPDRVLLKLVHVCPVYCRFCFRREMVGPGKAKALSPAALDAALAYIRAKPNIWEVVVTGGDPFAASARRIGALMGALDAIVHVRIVRFHTRVPIVDPARVTPAFVAALRSSGKAVFVALHANHAREFSSPARAAITRLADAGIPLLGQSVLLRGVNDSVEALAALMRGFVALRVKPYYLHHPDLAPGTSHFRVPIAEGQALMRALRGRLSGLCQPQYVLDIPGGFGKSPIGPGYITEQSDGTCAIEDFRGQRHAYPPPGDEPRDAR